MRLPIGLWPAKYVRARHDAGLRAGFISGTSDTFCGTCDRLRLMADGSIRNCLFSDDELSLRDVMRSNGSDDQLEQVFRASVWGKLPGHAINDPSFLQPRRTMSRIGG